MAAEDAERLWQAFQTDPVGTYEAVGQQLASAGALPEDPRLAEMYAEWTQQKDLAAYDAQMAEVAADQDVDPELLHAFVAAAEGNWENAVTMYRAHADAVLQRHGAAPPVAGDNGDYDPRRALHEAVEQAAAMASAGRRAR